MEGLRSCPFCGDGEPVSIRTATEIDTGTGYVRPADWAEEYAVVCSLVNGGCGSSSPFCETPAEAVAAWNRRASDAALAKAREALEGLVALVRWECPSLLDEDSGGDSRLSMEIDAALAALKEVE